MDTRHLEKEARTALALAAEDAGIDLVPGEDYTLKVKTGVRYAGRVYYRPAKLFIKADLWYRDWGWQWLKTALHELAHLSVGPGHGHDAAWQAEAEALYEAWGWAVEWRRTPGYEKRILDSHGETIWWRGGEPTDRSILTVSKVEAGEYLVTTPDGTEHQVYRPWTGRGGLWGEEKRSDYWRVSSPWRDNSGLWNRKKDAEAWLVKQYQDREEG